jgi:hypothetical protein
MAFVRSFCSQFLGNCEQAKLLTFWGTSQLPWFQMLVPPAVSTNCARQSLFRPKILGTAKGKRSGGGCQLQGKGHVLDPW